MLQKFLPLLNLLKNRLSPQREEVVPGVDLLSFPSSSFASPKFEKLLTFYRIAIGVMAIVFIVLFLYEKSVDSRLQFSVKTMNENFQELSPYSQYEAKARVIGDKITVYKRILQSQEKISSSIDTAMGITDLDIVVLSVVLTKDGFTIKFVGPTALHFANAVNYYLDTQKVDQLSLVSATLRNDNKSYELEMEGTFRKNGK